MTAALALRCTMVLTGLSVAIGSLELLSVRRAFSATGTWRDDALRSELGVLSGLLRHDSFEVLLRARFISALGLALLGALGVLPIAGAALALVVTVSSMLIAIRFRGAWNGGSDAMTLVLALGLSFALCGTALAPWIATPIGVSADRVAHLAVVGGLDYIAVQSTASYFIAGFVKLIVSRWRNGTALPVFLASEHLLVPSALVRLGERRWFALGASWFVIAFECAFPFALVDPRLALVAVSLAFLFHTLNVAAFGLNRFLFAWTATYPAIVFLSNSLNRL